VPAERLKSARGIEVGHIFYFGIKYSEALDVKVSGADGQSVVPEMGSYGIGVSRLVGAIIEANHDDVGIIWPEAVAPFQIALILAKTGDAACDAIANDVYGKLQRAGVEVLFDDRDERPGAKFATMDLIGIPHHLIVGNKAVQESAIEYKNRRTGVREMIELSKIDEWIINIK
jgi:prolyl-tRNA synthetase